jgi:hypothetical protein
VFVGLRDHTPRLRAARLAPLRPQLPPPRDLNVADED